MLAVTLFCACAEDSETNPGNGGDEENPPVVEDSVFSPSSVRVPSVGEMFDITAREELGWKVWAKPAWVQSVSDDGRVFTFFVDRNPLEEERSNRIGFRNDDGETVFVPVVQDGLSGDEPAPADPVFQVRSSYLLVTDAECVFDALVKTNTGGSVLSLPDWLEFAGTESMSDTEVLYLFHAQANASSSPREGEISLRNNRGTTLAINVKQYGKRQEIAGDSREWTQRSFRHRSLYIDFTGTWCPNCPRMARGLELACEKAGDKIVPVGLHCFGSAFDVEGGDDMAIRMGATALPAGVVDMCTYVSPDTENVISFFARNAVRHTEAVYPVSTGIAASSKLNGRTLKVDVTLYLKYADRYKITVWLTESGLVAPQKDYEVSGGVDNDYVHNHVMRRSLTDIMGKSFSTSEDLVEKKYTYETELPSGWNAGNMELLVFVSRSFDSKERIQSSAAYGEYYVDNCISVPLGTVHELELE